MKPKASRARDPRITATPYAHGEFVRLKGPRGFGPWQLHFPENMILDRTPGHGRAEMTWETAGDGTVVLNGRMAGEFAHAIEIVYRSGTDVIDLELAVTNHSEKKWKCGGEAMACLSPAESENAEFSGSEGRRTFVAFQGRLQPVANVMERFGREITPTTTVSLMVSGEQMVPQCAAQHDPEIAAEERMILRQSRDGKRLVAFAWDRVHRISMNFTYSCIHSNPKITGLAPGEREVRCGKIYFLECKPDEFLERYIMDFVN